jgi:lysophospholipase L1-like esterase
MGKHGSGRAPRRARALVTLGAAALGLFLCEAAVRWGGLSPLPQPVFTGDIFRLLDDPVQRYDNQPGAECTVTFVDEPGAPPRQVLARINADGFRGPRVPRERSAGVARIACVGDSHTFGWGVEEGETWPAVLSRQLDARVGPGTIEVLNAGVNAYDCEQERVWLERTVLGWKPDVVVWQWFFNDIAMPGHQLGDSQKPGFLLRLLQPRRGGLIGAARRASRAFDLVAERVYQRLAFDLYSTARGEMFADGNTAWLRTQESLRAAKASCQASGARFVVVLLPFLHRRGGELAGHQAHEQLAAFCRAEQIEVLDLDPLFAPLDVSALRLHPRETHANARAYELAGVRISDWILEQGFLTGGAALAQSR